MVRDGDVASASNYEAVTGDDLREIIGALVTKAKAGNVPAAREVLDRLIGKPVQAVHLEGPDGESLPGLSLADLQLAVVEALADEPSARAKVAQALRGLYDRTRRGTEGDG